MLNPAVVVTVAHLTLAEARRRRLATAAALCGAAFLAVFSTGVYFAHRELVRDGGTSFLERQAFLTFLAIAGLFASNFLSVLFAVLLPIDTLSGDIDAGIMQTVASKPVRRVEILLGKWLGHALIVCAYLLMLSGGVVLAIGLLAGFAPLYFWAALPFMLLEVLLLLTVSIAGGTRLTTVTNGVMALGVYGVAFIGGWLEQVGSFGGIESLKTIGIVASLLSPSDTMWRLASHYVQPQFVRDAAQWVFAVAAVPSPLMVWWALAYLGLTLAWGVRSFNRRPL